MAKSSTSGRIDNGGAKHGGTGDDHAGAGDAGAGGRGGDVLQSQYSEWLGKKVNEAVTYGKNVQQTAA